MQDQPPITIADLYPAFTNDERSEAEVNLRRYLAALLRMSEGQASEGQSINDLVDYRFADSTDPMYHPHRSEVETDQNN